jgi:uncharacterized DUF497 family protein
VALGHGEKSLEPIVVYSLVENGNGEEEGRIISARKTTPRERKAYEEGAV